MAEAGRRSPSVAEQRATDRLFCQCLGSDAVFGKVLRPDADTAAIRPRPCIVRLLLAVPWRPELHMYRSIAQYR